MNKTAREMGIESRKKIYDFLVSYISKNGYSPTIREISKATGIRSTSNVYHHLMKLERMGKIHMESNKCRAISLSDYKLMKEE